VSALVDIARDLARDLAGLTFQPPVTHVYRPLDYAFEPAAAYLARFGAGRKEYVLLGMNPGPFGMAQTGVPFGDVSMVKGWLGIEGHVGRPESEHPARPVTGFRCPRGEVSGRRLWGWAQERWGTPERFFERFFVLNYCPLAFLEARGANRTPDKLPLAERTALFAACDRALTRALDALQPRALVGIGSFALGRARHVASARSPAGHPPTFAIPHPSPASPAANRGWARAATAALRKAGVEVPGE
jgi:single-strand selective monofunctional uracil DNA glycosylase